MADIIFYSRRFKLDIQIFVLLSSWKFLLNLFAKLGIQIPYIFVFRSEMVKSGDLHIRSCQSVVIVDTSHPKIIYVIVRLQNTCTELKHDVLLYRLSLTH